MRETSPLNFRSTAGYATAYNPQQWGPISNTSANSNSTATNHARLPQFSRVAILAPRPVGPDDLVTSPPPPYSPRRDQEPQSSPLAGDMTSPSDVTSPDTDSSLYGTPLSTATTPSLDLYPPRVGHRGPATDLSTTASASPKLNAVPSFRPPPGASVSGSRRRSSSKTHADRMLSSLTTRGNPSTTTSPMNAIESLQEHTAHVLAQPSDPYVRTPAARRAASTGHIGITGPASRDVNFSSSPITWEKGMPMPPPPPGPPPTSARSQSLNRPIESALSSLTSSLPFRARRPPGHGTTLDTVPPTPADWRDEDITKPRDPSSDRSKGLQPLHIDTGSILNAGYSGIWDPTSSSGTPGHMQRDPSAALLFRSPAVRNRSAKGIRERRSDSRNGKGRPVEAYAVENSSEIAPSDELRSNVKPEDLILHLETPETLSHRANARATPKSGKSMQSLDGAMKGAEQRLSSSKAVSFDAPPISSRSTSAQARRALRLSTTIPAFSSQVERPLSREDDVPISPSSRFNGPVYALLLDIPPRFEQRPVSHILHMPNPNDSIQIPLKPSTQVLQKLLSGLLGPESLKAFANRAIERHRKFAECEATAADDTERLDIFVQFMIAESKIRRDQYATVFEEEDVNVENLSIGFFEKSPTAENKQIDQQYVSQTSTFSTALADSSSHDELSVTRKHESSSSATTNGSAPNRESAWMKDYIPSLSPIASMSIAMVQDEMDSRGRAPSRWWEDRSHSEDLVDDAYSVLGRSKRESKYMGVSREARLGPIIYEDTTAVPASNMHPQSAESSHQSAYGLNQYSLEKAEMHEGASSSFRLARYSPTPSSASNTPDPSRLDISRLVTLPPPYPRHHPAVSNSHPDLADTRAVVRSIHERVKAESVREIYRSRIQHKRQRAESWCQHQRSLHQQDVQFRIEHGEITPKEYESAEIGLEEKVKQSERGLAQDAFDLFQDMVVFPLHGLFSELITLATSSLEKLSGRLFSDAQSHSPNMPQEEGDEQPELLEKLTQLKWLFEAREMLYRQIYDLLSERNEKYKAVVLLPYQQSRNKGKEADAEAFFAQDFQDRKVEFEQAVSERSRAFLSVIENNVSRGVEMQLSAFWDISPNLNELLQKIPRYLEGFEIQIPPSEYVENPSYYDFPLQYLYSLLGHGEKSTYQFIESQINLLCLLNEIQYCALVAQSRADANVQPSSNIEDYQQREEKRLSHDLKEKVGVIEGQWQDALGSELIEVRERVRGTLLEQGGWNDEEEDV